MNTKDEPKNVGWVPVPQNVVGMLRAAQVAEHTIEMVNGKPYAPIWAAIIAAHEGVTGRGRLAALRKMTFDAEGRAALSTLLMVQDPDQQKLCIEEIVRGFENSIVCSCGTKFDEVPLWREHVEHHCPVRKKAAAIRAAAPK